ncbi:hypothetical protein [Micromonospora sp. NPDC047740]|uniref:hypothetical protein n=1 Tax=Micromonospora sp. NPDC047740 TaxID=3364254 RepID=UPI0037240F07
MLLLSKRRWVLAHFSLILALLAVSLATEPFAVTSGPAIIALNLAALGLIVLGQPWASFVGFLSTEVGEFSGAQELILYGLPFLNLALHIVVSEGLARTKRRNASG